LNTFFGEELIITGEVIYIGEGEDPKDNLGFQLWEKAFKEVYEKHENSPELQKYC